jgi:hypothetical protein
VQGGSLTPYYTYDQNNFASLSLKTDLDLDNNSAIVEGESLAFGENTLRKIYFFPLTTDWLSFSRVYSFSVINSDRSGE